jgi:hypothetical protein
MFKRIINEIRIYFDFIDTVAEGNRQRSEPKGEMLSPLERYVIGVWTGWVGWCFLFRRLWYFRR